MRLNLHYHSVVISVSPIKENPNQECDLTIVCCCFFFHRIFPPTNRFSVLKLREKRQKNLQPNKQRLFSTHKKKYQQKNYATWNCRPLKHLNFLFGLSALRFFSLGPVLIDKETFLPFCRLLSIIRTECVLFFFSRSPACLFVRCSRHNTYTTRTQMT